MRRSQLVRGLALFSGYLASPVLVKAADCLRDTREVAVGKEGEASAVRLRQYLCDHPQTGAISVQFNRLNDLAASLFIRGHNVFGAELQGVRVIENATLNEYKKLLKDFGYTSGQEGDFAERSIVMTDPSQGSTSLSPGSMPTVPVVTPAANEFTDVDFPDPQALESLVDHTTIPARYTKLAMPQNDNEVLIWRYMDAKDIADYGQLVQRYNQLVRGDKFIVDQPGEPRFRQFAGFTTANVPREIKLYRYLAQAGGLPSDFITITGARDQVPQCGYRKFWEFKYDPRELVVDFAIVQNRGQRSFTIDALLGAALSGGLRPMSSGIPKTSEQQFAVLNQPLRLTPGERVAIPVRLAWVVSTQVRDRFASELKKAPALNAYAWGPETRLAGLRVNNQTLLLEGSAANFFSVTTSCSCGSCPYLYAWDSSLGTWVNSGKIIDKAQGAALLQSESRSFTGYVSRFKLMEHEPELAHIASVTLELHLNSGARVKAAATRKIDHFELYMGDSMEVRFKLPRKVRREDVVSSKLTVAGYYDRYSDLLAERYGEPHSLSAINEYAVASVDAEARRSRA